ncbi:MAG TPA: GNAT family N-acetyltransferase [Actinophytocola sp.]|jgi:ribosomal protein S18 acetylase RimI-like enzyme|nr:GNAT family N-acetyltransferase [Actinophytocola sp.]
MGPRIRGYRPGDEPALYEICLRTGASGEDATGLYRDPNLLGEVYVGPYLRLAPTLAFVAEDEGGVSGYVLGAADTRAFELACEREWWPALRSRYALGVFPASSPDDRLARLIHGPGEASDDVIERYPAHLHIDLLPRLQGRGFGRRLLETLFDALRTGGVPAVHLGVGLANQRAIGFYERMGFTMVHRYTDSQIMARRL